MKANLGSLAWSQSSLFSTVFACESGAGITFSISFDHGLFLPDFFSKSATLFQLRKVDDTFLGRKSVIPRL